MKGRNEIVIHKMLKYCDEIQATHTHFLNDKDFFFDQQEGFVYRNSITMPLLQIGELAKHLSEDFLLAYRNIPWKEIMRMRDFFAHHYGSVEYNTVWETSHDDINDLKKFLLSLME